MKTAHRQLLILKLVKNDKLIKLVFWKQWLKEKATVIDENAAISILALGLREIV